MNTEPDFADDDGEFEGETLDLTPDMEADDAEEGDDDGDGDDQPDNEVDQPTDSDLIREMRRQLRETRRENKKLRDKVPENKPVEVGPRPTEEEFDWDKEKYDAAVDAWNERRFQAQQQASNADAPIRQDWEGDLARFKDSAAKLTATPGAKEALEEVEETLSPAQQMCLLKVSKDAAALMFALGKDPDKLDALAEITDPIKFTAEVTRMEMEAAMSARKKPAIDPLVRGRPTANESTDKVLARLEKEAERTGNRTAVIAYKAKLKAKKAA